ncbi:DUF983 domain-containing protein [Paroceanicella profunda]|uniref:DUF983 domain-containing protein n=1 Tax=Paroceanicella profunda TaxID=2579971 RepID=A0A5B8G1D5_9RHOB|nr:DUF983 domain-containing protein [Paroceanicella profunda]QDL92283.1 DUF983 domain-containing protein [Paroceanicella profunda]
MAENLAPDDRPLRPAVLRGLRRRCPRCGVGKLFSGYLRVNDCCDSCGLDLTRQRADDGPAYIVILIVGHVMGLLMLELSSFLRVAPLTVAAVLCVVALGLSMWMLPRVKGGFIAYQWAKGLHGF